MIELQARYHTATDGARIAWCTSGEGPAVMHMNPPPFTNFGGYLTRPAMLAQLASIYSGCQLVLYDVRGSGQSQRSGIDRSFERRVADLEEVADLACPGQFTIHAIAGAAPLAAAYAARHTERVSRLILSSAYLDISAVLVEGRLRTLVQMSRQDWHLATDTLAHLQWGWQTAVSGEFASFMRECVTQEEFAASQTAAETDDATVEAAAIRTPTLLIYSRTAGWPSPDFIAGVAATIPGSRVAYVASFGSDESAPLIREFLGLASPPPAASNSSAETAVILFADIAGSTRLTETLGDVAFRDRARTLDGALRAVISECAGTAIEGKLLGDGVLAVFDSARDAVACALRCNEASAAHELPLHLGVHAGDVIREDGNVFGGAVNIAARIAELCTPGDVLVSDTVRALARTSSEAAYEDRGERDLKGVSEAVRVYAVTARASQ